MQVSTLRAKYAALVPVLTERSRRVWAATEARAIGYGGIALVARVTGIAESTIQRGLRDLDAREPLPAARSRRPGGGRKRATETDSTLLRDLDTLVAATRTPDDFCRYEEERTGRRLQEWRADVAAAADAAPRARVRLRDPRDRHERRQGDSV